MKAIAAALRQRPFDIGHHQRQAGMIGNAGRIAEQRHLLQLAPRLNLVARLDVELGEVELQQRVARRHDPLPGQRARR